MLYIFTDASVDPIKKKAVGSYIITNTLDNDISSYVVNNYVFDDGLSYSSTITEFLIIKEVLNKVILLPNLNLTRKYLYTDCENFVHLIEKRQYDTKLKKHRNYQFYKSIFDIINRLKIVVIWTKGHSKKSLKTEKYEEIFSLVDKDAKNKLRQICK